MKCPNCDHVSDTALLKCSACGEAYDRDALETFQHLGYLLAWLDERVEILGAEAHTQLRGETLSQLDAARGTLGLVSMPSPEEIASELALVEAVRRQLYGWVGASGGRRASADHLHRHLSTRVDKLEKELVGRPAKVKPPSSLQVLDFALESLPVWAEELCFPPADVAFLQRYLDQKRTARLQSIVSELALVNATQQQVQGWVEATGIDPGSIADLRRYLSTRASRLKEQFGERSFEVEPPSDLQVLDFALESLQLGAEELHFPSADVASLRRHLDEIRTTLLQPAPSPVPAPPVPAPAAAPTPKPAALPVFRPEPIPKPPPKPKRPPIDWGKLWERAVEAAVSGALLRGLLYLGAFMIVTSAAILVVLFWDIFPEMVQLAFIAAVPAAFYLAGWGVRSRLKLPQAGGVLTGIGALLVAVDFAAVYQFGGLSARVDGNAYWLGASLFCTAVYAITAWRLPGEFFDYITLIGGSSVLLALTRLLELPLEWSVASVTASSLAMIGGAASLWRAPEGWRDFALAARRLPQILIPASLAVVLFVPGSGGDAALGQTGAFVLAALGYGLLAWRFPAAIFAHAAVWSSVGTAGFATLVATLPGEWYALTAAVLAVPYIVGGRWLGRRLDEDFAPRRAYLVAAYLAGFGLLAVAVLGGFVTVVAGDLWAGVIALALAALVLAGCAYLFRRPVLVLLASGLFTVPFSLAVGRWLLDAQVPQWGAWLATACAGLGLAYLGLAVLLRAAEKYGTWLNLWAHVLVLLASCGLLVNYGVTADGWFAGPTLAALGGVILVYLASAVIHDSGHHPALSNFVKWLLDSVGRAVFLWPVGLLLPVWLAVFWSATGVGWAWLGVTLAGLALAYVGLGQLLARRRAEYRSPAHVYAYALVPVAILIAWARGDRWALLSTLYVVVGVLGALAYVYRGVLETALAGLLFIWPFQLSLELSPLTPHVYSLAYALLAGLGYIPLGIALDKAGRRYALPIFVIEYGVSAYAVAASLLGRLGAYPLDVPWVGVIVPLVVASLQVLNVYRFKRFPFAWAAALVIAIAFGQALTLLRVPPEYDAAAWVGLAFAYLLTERGLARSRPEQSRRDKTGAWFEVFRWPLGAGAVALCTLSLLLTVIGTATAFTRGRAESMFSLILAQVLAVGLAVLAARLYRSRWPLYLEPALAFFPVTLFFVGYGESIFGQPLTTPQYGIVWSGLSLVHLLAGVLLDRAEVRYARGPYLGGYALSVFAVLWTLADGGTLLWTLGLGIFAAARSALLVHSNRHRTWDELISAFFGQKTSTLRSTVRGAFLWLAAWPFPVWCVLLLRQLNVVDEFTWLGFGVSALLFLGLVVRLRRVERTYAWPFHTAAQFYTALGLLISAPLTMRFFAGRYHLPHEAPSGLAFILFQALAVTFYAASAWVFRRRFFAHVASWLTLFPYTLAWIMYHPSYSQIAQARFAWAWTGWAAILLGVGFALDRAAGKPRYAHGPYLAGYVLAVFALFWSVPSRLTNLYTLAADIGLALVSHMLVHYERHHSFDDFVRFFWRKPGTIAQRAAHTTFLFLAAYAFPVWLTQLLTHHDVPLAWRGLALGLVAPIYIACGLAACRVKSEYTWPLYSAGYALTAIGAMVTFDNLALAIYVLALDAIVYAASAYIFRQPFWLYLSNILVPVIALLTLNYNESLSASWVGGTFMGLAFLYFGVGRWFDRRKETRFTGKNLVSGFALPFYAPGYVLSAVALAVASSERPLALVIYSAGVVLYALSAWAFRESVFLYPAAWLAAVPYYLGMTLTPLEPCWYGLGWLPLIVGYIALGRFLFHKAPLGIKNIRTFLAALTHSAMPFYLLAYGLSVSMMALSQGDPLPFTLALATGAAVYLASSALFRRPVWLYPGLLAAHLALMSYFTISPSGRPAYYITLPFLGMTWVMALIGYGFGRRFSVAPRSDTGRRPFRIWRWELGTAEKRGNWSFVGHLVTPSWAQPFFIFAALDLVLWQALALVGFETAIIFATGNAILLGLFAMLWLDAALAYGTLAFFLLAAGYRLSWAGSPFAEAFAWIGGIGFGLYLLARIAERLATHLQSASHILGVWPKPLTNAAVFLTAVAVVVTLPAVIAHTTATAAALAFAGALYLAIAYRGRYYRLGYLGMAMLQLAWTLALIVRDVRQPQWYAIPAGLYFTGVGYLERRRGRGLFAIVIESFGLAVLLVTSFIQSLNGAEGFPYFVLLLVEGLVVIWWGASQRLKVPFFTGLGASALNVVAQVVVLVSVYEVNRWFVILGVGLLLVTTAVFVERQRERFIARTQEWREALETWK